MEKNDLSGETNKEFRTNEDYYFFSGNAMQRIKKDKPFLLNFFADKNDKIEAYIKTNNLNCKSIEDIKKITSYFNLLQ